MIQKYISTRNIFCVSKNFDFSIIEKYSTISTIANLQDFDFLDSLDFIVFYLK